MTIVASSPSRVVPSNGAMKLPSRGIKKPKFSLHKRENSKLKDMELTYLNDSLLQSTSSHRRYMRRGSRTPMMFQIDAAAAMISHDPSLNEISASDRHLQSSNSLRCYMRRGSPTPMMFQLDGAALISHDPSFDDDSVKMHTSLRNGTPPHQQYCSPIMKLLALQLEGTNEHALHETSELQSSLAESHPAEPI
jgi:hypothetical protein